jgi:hypothetical protein
MLTSKLLTARIVPARSGVHRVGHPPGHCRIVAGTKREYRPIFLLAVVGTSFNLQQCSQTAQMLSRMGFVAIATHAENTASTSGFGIDAVRHEAQQPAKGCDLAIYGAQEAVCFRHSEQFVLNVKSACATCHYHFGPGCRNSTRPGSRRSAGSPSGWCLMTRTPLSA